MRVSTIAALLCLLAWDSAWAAKIDISMNAIDATGVNSPLGTIQARDSAKGLILVPHLHGLTAGPHGIHIHQNANCGPRDQDGKPVAGLAAGGHFDPQNSGKHMGPWQADGHQGDLPALSVNGDGTATEPLLAPHLRVSDIKGRAIIIHAGADNYSDSPKPLGGGGGRIACGIVP